MPAIGTTPFWNNKKLQALKKLCEKGIRKSGTINWSLASNSLPGIRRLLGEKSDSQLSKAYSKYKNVIQGKCYSCGKPNKQSESINCNSCRKKASLSHKSTKRFLVSKDALKINKNELGKHLSSLTKNELVNILTANIGYFPVDTKLDILNKFIVTKH